MSRYVKRNCKLQTWLIALRLEISQLGMMVGAARMKVERLQLLQKIVEKEVFKLQQLSGEAFESSGRFVRGDVCVPRRNHSWLAWKKQNWTNRR